jgi:transcriptional regulator with XRE-family HTH domain
MREERIRIGLKQDELAERAGISKNSLGAYERGETAMNVVLLLILQDLRTETGQRIDIGYVLTGRRSDGSMGIVERQMLDMLTKLSVRERQAVFNLVSTLAGEAIGVDELQAMSDLRATLHSPTRDFKGT